MLRSWSSGKHEAPRPVARRMSLTPFAMFSCIVTSSGQHFSGIQCAPSVSTLIDADLYSRAAKEPRSYSASLGGQPRGLPAKPGPLKRTLAGTLRFTPPASLPYGLWLPFLDVSVNRDDFGGRRLQFCTSDRNIERVSARANDHDHLVSCDDIGVLFNNTKPWSFLHVTHLPRSTGP